MTSNNKVIKTKTIEHPLESVFNIEEGTTIVEYKESLPAELVDHQEYDEKDDEIEGQFQEVYTKAMDAFDVQSDIVDTVEGKYAARNAEVAVQFLNAALNAAKEKGGLKQHKDKLEATKQNGGGPKTVNNNIIIDRNELLRNILKDNEMKDITNEIE
jgi:hypothetical protein